MEEEPYCVPIKGQLITNTKCTNWSLHPVNHTLSPDKTTQVHTRSATCRNHMHTQSHTQWDHAHARLVLKSQQQRCLLCGTMSVPSWLVWNLQDH